MLVNLDKSDFIFIILGTTPSMKKIKTPILKKCGVYDKCCGTWTWKRTLLKKLSEEELYNVYKICKK